jgi:signal transduction histidine kinase
MDSISKFQTNLAAKLHYLSLESFDLQGFVTQASENVRKYFDADRVNVYLSIKEPYLFRYCTSTTVSTELNINTEIRFAPNEGIVGRMLENNLVPAEHYLIVDYMQFNSMEIRKKEYLNYVPNTNVVAALIVGENRVLGAIEIVDLSISEVDLVKCLYQVVMTAQIFSRSIGTHLRSELIKTIQKVSSLGIDVIHRKITEEVFLKTTSELVINEELINYSAMILRIFSSNGSNTVSEIKSPDKTISWTNYINDNEVNSDSPSIQCYLTGKIISMSKIDDTCIKQFQNKDWILANKLKAYICIPILDEENCVGTMSFFLKYYYDFNNSDFIFLSLLSHSIGKTLGLDEILSEARRKVTEDVRASVRKISDLNSVKEFSHHYKNEIRAIQTILNEVIPTLSKGKVDNLKKLNANLSDRRLELEQFIKNNKGEPNLATVFSIPALLDDIISHFRSDLQYHYIVVEKNYAEVPYVKMDRNRLLEAISNIFQNAIKSFESIQKDKDKLITVALFIDSYYDEFSVMISDNGIGIKNDLLPDKIFEEGITGFPGVEGTGVGLFYSKSIMDSFLGDIAVVSAMNKGTTFTINFPRERFEEQ